MFIRRTTIKTRQSGAAYYTYRLVENQRVGGKVKQQTLLNLGRHFSVPESEWKSLARRIDQFLKGQVDLFDHPLEVDLERQAQYLAAKILTRHSDTEPAAAGEDYQSVDLDGIELMRPRRVGVEQLALYALERLQLPEQLDQLGFNRHQSAAALGNIVARMACPGSERATHQWLQQVSGLGELPGYDYEDMAAERLYHASDLLWKHKQALERHLYQQECSLFGFEETVTLYDLTHTFFEGSANGNAKAQYGRSKEKRSDCRLVTLGLVLDGSGFPRSSELFAGNVSEGDTLATMLRRLQAKSGALVVLDAGIASEANIAWLVEQGFRYLVVSRQRHREFDAEQAITVKDLPGQQVRVQRVVSEDGSEVKLYCHSEAREQKEQAMQERFGERLEQELQRLADGLSKKRTTKRYDKVLERIGRLKQKYNRAAPHYEIHVTPDPDSKNAKAITWKRVEKTPSQASHPGVYCLRTCVTDWDEATLWKTYTMLTDLEGVFRSLKSELGMRPIYHHKEERVCGHIFITLLAYHLVQVIRSELKLQGIKDSWQTIRSTMSNQQRMTVMLPCEDSSTVHIRKTSRAEPGQQRIYDALKFAAFPGTTQKTRISR